MNQNPMSSDISDPTASPEPSSTRPNPFDDSDVASRKRRRTSPSDSPARSLDAANQALEPSSSETSDVNMATSENIVKEDAEPVTPRTPEQQLSSQAPTTDAPSSMVTLNLRTDQLKDATFTLPTSPSLRKQPSESLNEASQVKSSVEAEVDLVAVPDQEVEQSQRTPSKSPPGSPAIEVITITEDEDMGLDEESPNVSIIREDRDLVNPLLDFPYADADENVLEPLHRLIQYITTQTTIDDSVVRQIQQWLHLYLIYVRDAGQQAVWEVCRQHRAFWMLFPDVAFAMTSRKTPLLQSHSHHDAAMDFYLDFAQLTAWFVMLDYQILLELQSRPVQQDNRNLELFSTAYLQQLHAVIRCCSISEQVQELEISSQRPEDALALINKLQASRGGDFSNLAQLATVLIDLVPAAPRLMENIVPICNLSADIMTESIQALRTSQSSKSPARQRLELGHKLHNKVSDLLAEMIEKHVTHMSSECVSGQINALTDMLKSSLHGNHDLAIEAIKTHRLQFPDLTDNYTLEAIVWEKRFDTLIKLIRSSQMQLRVMAVTTMCNDLVSRWKAHNDAGQETSATYLDHLAEYLLRTGLIEYVLGANCHPEITVESANIVGFLVVTKKYRAEHTDLLWQGITSSQDPRISEALTRMISTITNLFDYPGLVSFCEKLQTLPVESFTPAMKGLWESILRSMLARANADRATLSFHPYELCLRLLRESSICASGLQVAYPEMQHLSMQRLRDLLAFGPDFEARQQLYLSCIGDIAAKSSTTLGSLWGLSMAIRPTIVAEMRVLAEEHDLTRLIVEELEHATEMAQAAGVKAVLCTNAHQPRQDFIMNIIQLEPHTINDDIGRRLWDVLVGVRSPCVEDRTAGWNVLNSAAKRSSFQNSFLRKCFTEYLPSLPCSYFCGGMLDFIREEILPRVTGMGDLILDDEEQVAQSGIEQLWRIILSADDDGLVYRAIRTLALDVYLESDHILTFPFHRTQKIHLSLVNRSLRQLKDAAREIASFTDGDSNGDDESMVIVATEDQIQEQERVFVRSLRLLRFFLEAHRLNPRFAAPDVRALMSQTPQEIEGASAELKYQSFDGHRQTEVKPLSIGKLNTAASLLASIKQETGFGNYRAFYRGRPFYPNEREICKSLEDLHIHDGLILVKREEDSEDPPPDRIKPGASSLEIEVSSHFDELWEYLNMEEKLAQEIYHFLLRLPTDGHTLQAIDDETMSYEDVFPPGQPYKSLYAVHALVDYVRAIIPDTRTSVQMPSSPNSLESTRHAKVIKRSTSLVVQAISDHRVLSRTSEPLRVKLSSSLMHAYLRFIDDIGQSLGSRRFDHLDVPTADRLVDILSSAIACKDEAALSLISGTLAATLQLSLQSAEFWDALRGNATFFSLLRDLLLFDTRKAVRASAVKQIEEITAAEGNSSGITVTLDSAQGGPEADTPLFRYFWEIVSDLVPQAVIVPTQCDELFRFACSLLSTATARSPGLVDIQQLASTVAQLLLDHESIENINQIDTEDIVARGLVSLLLICVQFDGSLPKALPSDLGPALFCKLLYPRKRGRSEEAVPGVLLNTDTRIKLGEIVFTLVKDDKPKLQQLLEEVGTLAPYYVEDEDPYLYELPYQFDRFRALRSPCGYAGLQNLSNTCYLNSLLTQLFMNTSFRRFIMESRVDDAADSQQLLFYTQKLFGYMQDSYRRFIDPAAVVSAIKTYDDAPIDIHNQMDVDEFYNLLFDRWEGQMTTSAERKNLRSFYGGQLVQQVKSKECEHISERLEPFSAIQCDIKGKSTLQESLQAYVDGEIMEGDNKYKCSTCDRHVDAVKRACLKDIPDNVIFHLKRFDFNLRTLQRNKINDYFQFPTRVDMRPYTIEHLSDPSAAEEEDVFELVGVLVHSGTAESGHYYSYIRERPASVNQQGWVEFNDDMVSPWDPALLESSTFGGPDHRPSYDSNGIVYDKSYSAYMLFYQRASSLKAEQESLGSQKVSIPLRVDIPLDLREHILDENTVLLRRHCLFDPSHAQLLQRLFQQTGTHCKNELIDADVSMMSIVDDENPSTLADEHALRDMAMWTALNHLDQAFSRTKDLPFFGAIANMLSDAVFGCRKCAFTFYDYFNKRHAAFRALLQRHPEVDVRAFIGRTFINALERISTGLPQVYLSADQRRGSSGSPSDVSSGDGRSVMNRSVLDGAILIFNHLWRYFQVNIRSWDEFFSTILGFAKLGKREVAFLLSEDYLLKLIRIVSADPMMDLPSNYARMLHNVLKRISTRPPSYSSIIALIHKLIQELEPTLGPDAIVDCAAERLDDIEKPFNWTSEEVHAVHQGLEDQSCSLFVEKLLGIDQAQVATDDIVRWLIRTGAEMDGKIYNTLKRNIRGDISTQSMDPFLRAATIYIQHTASADCATRLALHISTQAKNLQNTEGSYLLKFFKAAVNLQQPDGDFVTTVRDFSLGLIPKWAPYLLVYPDGVTRRTTEDFLDDQLFQHSSTAMSDEAVNDDNGNMNDDGNNNSLQRVANRTAVQLGVMCLAYLQENHLRRRMQIGEEAASGMIRVIRRCARVYESDPELQDDANVDFRTMQNDILDPLRRLIVEDVEDDGSGMFQSLSDSDTITADFT